MIGGRQTIKKIRGKFEGRLRGARSSKLKKRGGKKKKITFEHNNCDGFHIMCCM